MIIHLEASWDDATLERFALIISQQSIHVALQLNWILQGAIEDYQPENADGLMNPSYNALFYVRCVKLLRNLERCVVYGAPRTHELQQLFDEGKINQDEYEQLELADRQFNAENVLESVTLQFDEDVDKKLNGGDSRGGYLLYKRRVRKSHFSRKQWKMRYFKVNDRVLHCYNYDPRVGGKLIRAMPLEGATVTAVADKYPHLFEVKNHNYIYRARAADDAERVRWVEMIREESDCRSLYDHRLSSVRAGNDDDSSVMTELSPAQLVRYNLFNDERHFVRAITDIAETLRFKERNDRKKEAPGLVEQLKVSEAVYIPLCNSTDIWRRVDSALPKETRVFNTNERCPTLLYFLSKRGEGGKDRTADVGNFLSDFLKDSEHDENIKNGHSTSEDSGDKLEGEKTTVDGIDKIYSTEDTIEAVAKSEDGKEGSDTASRSIWHEDKPKRTAVVKEFMKEHMRQALPKNIAKQIEEKRARSRRSILDMATLPMQSVKIVNALTHDEDDDAKTTVSECDIDEASLNRAKEIICGGEDWNDKCERLLAENEKKSESENDESIHEIQALISKSNDDLRQEVFVMQMIHYYKSVFIKEGLPIWLHTYRILSTSKTTGFLEFISNSTSIDGLKKSEGYPAKGGLRQYFLNVYGPENSTSFKTAQNNFMKSLVGYSLVSYLLGLKDRHNGNIMIDIKGHLIFIDFGFAMGMAPGHEFSMERAPFKLTADYVEVMGGRKSACFAEFERLFVAGFEAARANSQVALGLVEIMMYKSNFPCFTGSRYGNGISLKKFEDRLMLDVSDAKIKKKALHLIR